MTSTMSPQEQRTTTDLEPISSAGEDFHDDVMSTVSGNNMDASTRGKAAIYELNVAKKEDKWVWRLRVLTALLLISVAISICLVIYFTGRQSETKAFEQDFESLGEKLVSSFQQKVIQSFQVLESFNDGITAEANGTWPFVTPPHFSERMERVAKISQFMVIHLMIIVTREHLQEWNNYSVESRDWRLTGMARERGLPIEQVNETIEWFPEYLYNPYTQEGVNLPTEETNPDGPYAPIWITYPVSDYPIANLDLLADWEHIVPLEKMIATGKPIFEFTYDYMGHMERDIRWELIQGNPFVDYQDDPHSTVVVPVFDGFGDDRKVAANLMVYIYWRAYFNNLLPPGADGIIIVLENTCNQTYTYRVDGSDSFWLGRGDLHDSKYDYLEASTNINVLAGGDAAGTTDFIDDTESDFAYYDCYYNIRVYPSQAFEDSHRSSSPWVFALIIAALFFFTTTVFVTYAYMVERRQQKVLESAVQSGKLVSTLFPEEVRKQLYKEQIEQDNKASQKQPSTWDFVPRGSSNVDLEGGRGALEPKAAIAALYPSVTIFFADLVGFTKWSANRTPQEVFQLLETIYGGFDKIAKRRHVFKVETVGDCYVAAVGLPEPEENHAVIMCKFASDCLRMLDSLVITLAETLGEDTANLSMRVGLHSGPVTAGVLRGEKSRFQLFGDTVNTASRMESTGIQGRIQVSEATANQLIARGRKGWLKPREDTIVAKGKGEMQSYFVQIAPSSSANDTESIDDAEFEDL
ncbi:Receptor-type guanylate cyclase gcy [Seminavis robusta]|uniref:Receptor-type guanylate cyclase gcy n=1 Tax=Seminavis robusta TaxID=568900 RepID=A0A9N8E056_9STRA|nr:Receptor-type guanylate cyclase gcy [Seminavis robusta]|eukprot:Sro380_g130650.1 Receptor-type guanylate cyclase gcy (750) ;mRNA; r:32339-35313